MNASLSQETIDAIKNAGTKWQELKTEVQKNIVGQAAVIDRISIGLLCNGHLLLEGLPGLAKTTLIKSFAKAIDLGFARIQFTPDLLPSDLIGTLIYNPKEQSFITKKGPIFTNLVLADEINRAPAKVQSALLEAMQESQVTIGENTFELDNPFLVLATQNPIEQEGTYRLPEAQLDRFLFKIEVGYPSKKEEVAILEHVFARTPLSVVFTKEEILRDRKLLNSIYIDEKIIQYIVDLIFATRNPANYNLHELSRFIKHGASPRGTIALHSASRALALIHGRHFVTPDDVKAIAIDTLRHRILLTYEAEIDNVRVDKILARILEMVPSP